MKKYLDRLRRPMRLIDEASGLEVEKLHELFSVENVEALKILIPEFYDNDILPNDFTPSVFSSTLFELCTIKKKWGRMLGNAIIRAADSDANSSINILNDFIENCPSKYFRSHAQNQIDYYKERL